MHTKSEDKIREFLKHARCKSLEETYAVCDWLFRKYISEDDQPELVFRWFLENADTIESDDTESYKIRIDLKEYIKEYGELVAANLDYLFKENKDPDTFYAKLWKLISENTVFDTVEKKIFAMFSIWIDPRIPYFKLDSIGLKMENVVFAQITSEIRSDIDKARFIMNTDLFEQRTMRASVLLSLLDKYTEEEEKRTVLMAHVLSFLTIPKSGFLQELIKREAK